MARQIGWQETKIRFFAGESTQMTKIVSTSAKLVSSLRSGQCDVTNQSACLSLVVVKCWSDETYIFLANSDRQRKLLTTEEDAKIQLEAVWKMCNFWVCRLWIKPKRLQQQSGAN